MRRSPSWLAAAGLQTVPLPSPTQRPREACKWLHMSCFAREGADFAKVKLPFALDSTGSGRVSVANVRITREARPGLACPDYRTESVTPAMRTYSYGHSHRWMQQPVQGRHHRLRLTQRRQMVSFHHATTDGCWMPNPWLQQVEVMHQQNTFNSLHSLRLALFAAGVGEVRMKRFTYRRLDA